MAKETRKIDHCFFIVDEFTVGCTETLTGDFTSYDSEISTTAVAWWLERRGQRSPASIAEIEHLIRGTIAIDAAALAAFFAEARGYGFAIIPGGSHFVDFSASFGRDPATIYPRLNGRTLHFVARKTSCYSWPLDQEFWDIKVNLDTTQIEAHCFWSGHLSDLVLKVP